MKKILVTLVLLGSLVCYAETFNAKKYIEIDFAKKDCTVVSLTDKKTFVNCNNAKYMVTYDTFNKFYKIALIDEEGKHKVFLTKK